MVVIECVNAVVFGENAKMDVLAAEGTRQRHFDESFTRLPPCIKSQHQAKHSGDDNDDPSKGAKLRPGGDIFFIDRFVEHARDYSERLRPSQGFLKGGRH